MKNEREPLSSNEYSSRDRAPSDASHPDQFFFIQNRYEKKLAVTLYGPAREGHLAIVSHGLGATQKQDQVLCAVRALADAGYGVVTFDASCSFGDSDGSIETATLTRHSEDLEDVLKYFIDAKIVKKAALLGFSIGAAASMLVAADHSECVESVICIGPVVSGKDWWSNFEVQQPGSYEILMRTGSFTKFSEDGKQSGLVPMQLVEDMLRYDVFDILDKVALPVSIIVGSNDKTCSPSLAYKLSESVSQPLGYYALDGIPHTFRDEDALSRLYRIIRGLGIALSQYKQVSHGSLARPVPALAQVN